MATTADPVITQDQGKDQDQDRDKDLPAKHPSRKSNDYGLRPALDTRGHRWIE